MFNFHTLALALAVTGAFASPTPERRDGVTTLSADLINPWREAAHWASAAYCSNSDIKSWSCGPACSAVAKPTKVYGVGGDNNLNPYWYVANNGSMIIVSVCGTNPLSAFSVGVDLDFALTTPDSSYFPNNGGAQIHHGFYGAFTRLSGQVAAGVQQGLNDGVSDVLVIGHSLGAAIGHQVAVHLAHKFPQATVYGRLFASPRVGNKAWADYVDQTLGSRAQHLVNLNDIVPQLPPSEWGFQQSSNEIWISDTSGSKFISCPGQENPACQDGLKLTGDLFNFAKYANLAVHLGPYAGVFISSLNCKI